MKRSIAALVLAGVLSLGICACGQKPAETKAEQKTEAATEQVQQSEAPTEEASDASAESGQSQTQTETEAGTQDQAKAQQSGEGAAYAGVQDEYAPKWSAAACTTNALASVGAGDSANNITTSDLIEGGGTFYYLVEFDLDEAHFRVQVDATDGAIIDVIESIGNKIQHYNEDGTVTEVEM